MHLGLAGLFDFCIMCIHLYSVSQVCMSFMNVCLPEFMVDHGCSFVCDEVFVCVSAVGDRVFSVR